MLFQARVLFHPWEKRVLKRPPRRRLLVRKKFLPGERSSPEHHLLLRTSFQRYGPESRKPKAEALTKNINDELEVLSAETEVAEARKNHMEARMKAQEALELAEDLRAAPFLKIKGRRSAQHHHSHHQRWTSRQRPSLTVKATRVTSIIGAIRATRRVGLVITITTTTTTTVTITATMSHYGASQTATPPKKPVCPMPTTGPSMRSPCKVLAASLLAHLGRRSALILQCRERGVL